MAPENEEVGLVASWGYFCTEEAFGRLEALKQQPGSQHSGVFFVPPQLVSILFADGVWREVNERCATTLDQFEEDELSPAQVKCIASVVREISSRYVDGVVQRTVGWREGEFRTPILATMTAQEIRALLASLSEFLEHLAYQEKLVIASL